MDKKETSMKNWDATKAKFYSEIMGWCSGFLGLSEEATESELHEATQSVTDTLAQIRQSAISAATEAVAAQMSALNEKVEANTASITELSDKLKAKEKEAETLSGRVTELESSLSAKDKELSDLKAAHDKEKVVLSAEISKLRAGKPLEGDLHSETVTSELGNGGGKSAGMVIENSAMNDWLRKPATSKN